MKAELKKYPVTFLLCGSWIAVFALMAFLQGGLAGNGLSLVRGIEPGMSLQFGAQSSQPPFLYQFWRALTATFVHYSLLHIFFNLLGMFQLGQVVESWYGSKILLGLYVLIGFVGNMLAVLFRVSAALLTRSPTAIATQSAGGSSVLCGLIAFLAVVGWRSKTRYGDYLRAQMVFILILTAVLGLALPHIDNYGHAGGAIVGGLLGFCHPLLVRMKKGRAATIVASLAVLVILASAGAQALAARSARVQMTHSLRAEAIRLSEVILETRDLYLLLGAPDAELKTLKGIPRQNIAFVSNAKTNGAIFVRSFTPAKDVKSAARARLRVHRTHLMQVRGLFADPATLPKFDRLVALIGKALTTVPSLEERKQFAANYPPVEKRGIEFLQANGINPLVITAKQGKAGQGAVQSGKDLVGPPSPFPTRVPPPAGARRVIPGAQGANGGATPAPEKHERREPAAAPPPPNRTGPNAQPGGPAGRSSPESRPQNPPGNE